MRAPRPVARAAIGVAVFTLAVWNGVYDLLVKRGEQGYLLEQARSAAGQGPGVVLHEFMAEAIGYAVLVASGWAGASLAAGLLLIWYVRRAARREPAAR